MEQIKKKKRNKTVLLIIGILLLAVVAAGIFLYNTIFQPFSLPETAYIHIDREKNYEEVVRQLKEEAGLPSEKIFRLLADRMNYPHMVKTGRYAIEDGMTMPDVIRRLRSGIQAPVNLTFNNMRTRENLAGRISQQLMIDSLSLLNALNDAANAEKFGFDEHMFITMFIPNTYEVYWDTSIDNLLRRMKKEYDLFWNEGRKEKAGKIGLTPVQVSTLASIVEEEATYADEYPIVAGLYLNRLNRGMRLEADPTIKFAVGDFSLRRILYRHLEVESPYNTYKNGGLPPGPIRIPSIQAIEATLSPQQHRYLFMCAKDDLSGRHNFATTHAEHARNAAAYQRALNARGIY
ncbi:YceG-like family [Proteiniphilum saccharofermentans]|uniref:Endolytic murein transglycosylase n=1 Tax=Proteiniphilum saccharofermentans TaxID=1642647 RepID=A0A1R3T5K0_9BACT|nr:endolytic transglycosylase MltG [Proteiniphilum saccharofermentans]SCD19245.1 YceG-like family [Proteiniphilum saccharofermentans]